MQLSPEHRRAVMLLSTIDSDGSTECGRASGFLYSHKRLAVAPGDPEFSPFVVTCRHVVESVHEGQSLRFRCNLADGRRLRVSTLPEEWTSHPLADIAVCELSKASQHTMGTLGSLAVTYASDDGIVTKGNAEELGVAEGEGVFVIGFPDGWMPGSHDYPVVRSGTVAQIAGWLNDDHDSMLILGSVFPGNSGGTVIMKPQAGGMGDQPVIRRNYLLGVVSAAKITDSISQETTTYENADLGVVVPMDYVNETIQLAIGEE